jgi:DNA adenine methylase
MPYIIKRTPTGFKVCLKSNPDKCFSKEGIPLERAKKQMKAIIISEKSRSLFGGLKPLTARLGGKVLLKKKLVDEYFPNPSSYTTYVEPFVGGGSVYFYKNKDGHKEVVNDIDPLIYTIFKGFQKYPEDKIANDVNGDYTKSDFNIIVSTKPSSDYDIFKKAFLINRLSFFARSKTFGKPRINASFKGYNERLDGVTILNEDWKKVIKEYDGKNAFIYLDPPAVEADSQFTYPAIDVGELKKVCDGIKGKFCLTYPDRDAIDKVFSKYNCNKITTKYVGDRTTGGQTVTTTEWIITNYKSGSARPAKKFKKVTPFEEVLKSKGIQPEDYLNIVKHVAKSKGYDPELISFADDGKHKLIYDSPNGIRKFGSAPLNDYIIYNMKEGIDFEKGTAEKKRYAYHARFTDGKAHEKYSPWELSLNILW